MDEQRPSNSDWKSSRFEAAGSKKLKEAPHNLSSEQKSAHSSGTETVTGPEPETSHHSGRMAWLEEKRQGEMSWEGDTNDKTKGKSGKKERKKRRKRRRQRRGVETVELMRESWRRERTPSSDSSASGPVQRSTVETVIEGEKEADGESAGCVDSKSSKEDKDGFDAGIELNTAAARRILRMKRSFATTADSSGEEKRREVALQLKEESGGSSCCEEEGRSSLLGGVFERATVHNCLYQDDFTNDEQAGKGCEIGGTSLLIANCSVSTSIENESENDLLNSDFEGTSKCSFLGVLANDEKEEEIFDPPSTEILDYKSILSALKEKHREQQRTLQDQVSSPLFWSTAGW